MARGQRRQAAGRLTALALALVPAIASGQPPELDAAARQIVRLTNQFRQGESLGGLETNARLTEAAQVFAEFMARTGKYGHRADGQSPVQRATAQGYEHCLVAENIAYQASSSGFDTQALAKGFVEGWKQSPEHRANMLLAAPTQTGVAIAGDQGGRYFAVQMLGRPAAQSIRFEIVNRSGGAVHYRMEGNSYQLGPRVTRTHKRCTAAQIELGQKTLRVGDGERLIVRQRCPSAPASAPQEQCVALESAR